MTRPGLWLLGERTLVRVGPGGDVFAMGALSTPCDDDFGPQGLSALVLAPYDIVVTYTDSPLADPAGVFLLRTHPGAAPAGILRDDSIGALSPRPDFAARFPLAPCATGELEPGTLDPDSAAVGDRTRPLVRYQLGFPTGAPLKRVRTQTSAVQLLW